MSGYRFDLDGRVALVTGASSGIGARFAGLLARSGAAVALCARRIDRLEAAVGAIVAAGGRAVAIAMDATSEASTIAAFDAAEAALGPVDTVIANAGMSTAAPALTIAVEDFDASLALNLRGSFLTAREGARRMIAAGSRERENGRIVLTASITASVVDPGTSAYSASKAGVVQLGRVLAREWIRQGINVNVICPGYIRTDLNAAWFDSEPGQRQVAGFGRRRLMDEAGLDALLLYLASDASFAVTGSVFTGDDGQSL